MEPFKVSPPGEVEASASAIRTLGPLVLAISLVPIVVLVPLAVDIKGVFSSAATLTGLAPSAAFYPVKFLILAVLSMPLVVAVLAPAFAGRKRLGVPMLVPALAFLGVSTLSALFSGDFAHTLVGDRFDGLISQSAGFLLFYATALYLDSRGRVRFFLGVNVVTATLVSLYGILQKFGLDPVTALLERWPSGERAASTVGNPVLLASYLTLMLGAALALYFLARGRRERFLWLGALALVGACWLYTYTRGAWLGVAVALPIVLWLAHRRVGGVRPLLPPLAVLAAVIVVAQVAALLLSPTGTAASADRAGAEAPSLLSAGSANASTAAFVQEAPLTGETSVRDTSVRLRLLIWRDTIPMILERPLLGHGPDNFTGPFMRHQGEDLRAILSYNVLYMDKPHNQILQVAATTGLLGLAAYLWLLVSYFRNAYRSGGWVLLALSGGMLAYLMQIQTSFTTIVDGVAFWAVLGASAAVMRLPDLREPARE